MSSEYAANKFTKESLQAVIRAFDSGRYKVRPATGDVFYKPKSGIKWTLIQASTNVQGKQRIRQYALWIRLFQDKSNLSAGFKFKTTWFPVHYLVWIWEHGPFDTEKYVIYHKNGIKRINGIRNLAIGTKEEAFKAYKVHFKQVHKRVKEREKVLIKKIISMEPDISIADLAVRVNCNIKSVSYYCKQVLNAGLTLRRPQERKIDMMKKKMGMRWDLVIPSDILLGYTE